MSQNSLNENVKRQFSIGIQILQSRVCVSLLPIHGKYLNHLPKQQEFLLQGISQQSGLSNSALVRLQILISSNFLDTTCSWDRAIYALFITFFLMLGALYRIICKNSKSFFCKNSLNAQNSFFQHFWFFYAFLVRMIACTLHIK